MQKKIGTILDEGLLIKIKQKAHQERITLNHLFEEALLDYLIKYTSQKPQFSAVEASFGVMKLSARVAQKIAKEDIYETE